VLVNNKIFSNNIISFRKNWANYYQHIFTKRALSKVTGVNESLLSQYAMGIKKPLSRELQSISLM